MRSILLFVCATAVVTLSVADVNEQPVIAMPITDGFVKDPPIQGFLSDLLERGGFGRFPMESAAFLILESDGSYRCELWPFNAGHHMQRFEGKIPNGTVAIAHTHPMNLPEASPHDRDLAVKRSVPILVLTPYDIQLVTPRGETVALVQQRFWSVSGSSSSRCSAPDAHASLRR